MFFQAAILAYTSANQLASQLSMHHKRKYQISKSSLLQGRVRDLFVGACACDVRYPG